MKLLWFRLRLPFLLFSLCLVAAVVHTTTDVNPEDTEHVEGADDGTDVAIDDEEPRPPYDPTLVMVNEGQVRGLREEARNGKEFYAFRSIPFAKPPTGELRFEPAQPVESWDGVLIANEDPPACPQISMESLFRATEFQLVGQEDCLYLNVFSPMKEQMKPKDPLLPVMVFIHGGAYLLGGASQYSPHILMGEDIVFVVIQYRLGTLGFLSTEDKVAPGNMGILDQTLALKWVQQNIHKFGGNPLQITIFGESAGSSSVHLQMLSHASLGYFHRAIMQSGTTLSPWAIANNHRQVAYFIAAMVGCEKWADEQMAANCTKNEEKPGTYEVCVVDKLSSETIIKCLKETPVDTLAQSATWFFKVGISPLMMGPRVDDNLLMQEPAKLIKELRFKKVDIMMGTTKDEGAMTTAMIYSNEGLRSAMRFKFEEMAPVALDFCPGDIAPLNQTIKIFDFYVGSSELDENTADGATAMFGDRMMWYPSDTAAFVHSNDHSAKRKNKKTFVYEFAYRGQHSVNDHYELSIGKHWVTHADELIYLFGAPADGFFAFGKPLESEEDKRVSEAMVKMWTNFAATGNPTPEGVPAEWVPFSPESPAVLIIDKETRMSEPDYKKEIREFWRQLPLKTNLIIFPELIANLTKIEIASEDAGQPSPVSDTPEVVEADSVKDNASVTESANSVVIDSESPSNEEAKLSKDEL